MSVAEAVRAAADRHRPYVPPPVTFEDFLLRTTNFKLDNWQRVLVYLFESLLHTKGRRILLHAMPQIGKSILQSKRFPAYFLGKRPGARIVLAGYNITHTTEQFSEQVRNVMHSPEYKAMFPDARAHLPSVCAAGAFSTNYRSRLHDGQDSLVALGLQTGFVGKGVGPGDLLLIDDPYASPEEAKSEAINNKTNRFWTENADLRVDPDANVVATFHRYHEDDFAGRRLAESGWEYYRFPALADEDEIHTDPTRSCILSLREFYEENPDFKFRELGEVLSPRRTEESILKKKASDPQVFLSQYQGRPRAPEGAFFLRQWLKTEPDHPPIKLWVRFWDLTAAEAKSTDDYFAGAMVGIGPDHTVWLKDMMRFREQWPSACDLIEQTTRLDLEWCEKNGYTYQVGVEKVFWQLAMIQDLFELGIFQRVELHPVVPDGDKKQRASGVAARAKNDKFRIVHEDGKGDWIQPFINEAIAFDGLGLVHDDQIDALSGAYRLLWALKGDLKNEEEPPAYGTPEYWALLRKNASDR